ncbi:MAG: hypothetical protein QOF66_6794 [Mycobacterium sp.]|nr:hypothetical protein [Mycobacterium sp.]
MSVGDPAWRRAVHPPRPQVVAVAAWVASGPGVPESMAGGVQAGVERHLCIAAAVLIAFGLRRLWARLGRPCGIGNVAADTEQPNCYCCREARCEQSASACRAVLDGGLSGVWIVSLTCSCHSGWGGRRIRRCRRRSSRSRGTRRRLGSFGAGDVVLRLGAVVLSADTAVDAVDGGFVER